MPASSPLSGEKAGVAPAAALMSAREIEEKTSRGWGAVPPPSVPPPPPPVPSHLLSPAGSPAPLWRAPVEGGGGPSCVQ